MSIQCTFIQRDLRDTNVNIQLMVTQTSESLSASTVSFEVFSVKVIDVSLDNTGCRGFLMSEQPLS